jgi:DNA-directed RNA polymerase subunit M/transcription elongation factor TFIIS
MIIKFNDSDELLCPKCGHNSTHHSTIDVYERKEDSQIGTHTHVHFSEVRVDANMAGNPSSRRSGILIAIDCEECKQISFLKIAQHKGTTQVFWGAE